MKYLDFEKHIKRELEGSKEAVQMDALLASLNLGNEPKRQRIAYWKIVPFLLLGLSVFAWMYIEPAFNEGTTTQVENASTVDQKSSGDFNSTTIINQEENTTTEQEETLENTPTNILSSSNNEISTKEESKTKTSIYTTESATTNTRNISPAIIDAPTNTTFISNPTSLNKEVESSNLQSSYIQPKETFAKVELGDNDATVPSTSEASRNLLTIARLIESVDALENNSLDGNLFSRMKINCPSFDNVGWHMALIPEVGIFLPKKSLMSTSQEVPAAYDERIKSETTLEGIELGLYGMLVRDNVPFYLKAGISYSRISERMDLQYEYTRQDTTIDIISSTVSANGDTITHIYGDVITETTFKGSNRQHYYIHLFDVPISMGYTTYIGGLDIGIEGGVKVNFMTRATGNLLTSQKDYTNLSLNRLFKNRIGLSYFGGLMIGRNFGRYGDFYIAPRFTYYPNDFNNQNNPVSQRYFTVGLNAGVVYKID